MASLWRHSGAMELGGYVAALRRSLMTAAAAGGEQARETARLLADTIEPAVRLALIDAMSALAAEVTAALDGDLVDVRIRRGEPEVVVVPAAPQPPVDDAASADPDDATDDGTIARISRRLPDALKSGAEAAAGAGGGPLRGWLVGAVAGAAPPPKPAPASGRTPRRYVGFARS